MTNNATHKTLIYFLTVTHQQPKAAYKKALEHATTKEEKNKIKIIYNKIMKN